MSSTELRAFALVDDVVDTFEGGLVTAGDEDHDLAELVAQADDGVIVLEADDPLADLLGSYRHVFKSVDVPAGAGVHYNDRKVPRLRAELKARGIAGAGSSSKPELVAALEHHDELTNAGVAVERGTSITDLMALEAAVA